jgi:hypothetical protein
VLREEGEVQKHEWGGILQEAQCEAARLCAEIDAARRARDDLLRAIDDDARAEGEFVAMLVESKLEGARLALEIDECVMHLVAERRARGAAVASHQCRIRLLIREAIKVQVRQREAERIRQASFIDFDVE